MNETIYKLNLVVRNEPGVLVRVAQVFARRGCNISAVHVTPHAEDNWSNMAITVRDVTRVDQIIHHLEKLIDVKSVHIKEK